MADNPLALRRMWKLRQLPMFAAISLGDLALLAENVIEVSYSAGAVVAPAGPPRAVELLISGEIAAAHRRWAPGDALGLLEILGKSGLAYAAKAMRPTRTLQLAADDVDDVLEEGAGIMRAVLRELAARVTPAGDHHALGIDVRSRPLGLVDRIHVLRRVPPFETSRVDSVAALAHIAEEAITPSGATLTVAGERATRAHVVLEGALRLARDEDSRIATAGTVLGGIEVVGELSHRFTTTAVTPVRTLALDAHAVLDVLEEHPDLGLAVGARLAATLL